MRLSELMGARVVDADGEVVGAVTDVRLVRDGPVLGTFGAAYVVEALVITPGRRGGYFGYERSHFNRPTVINWLLSQLHKGSLWAPWAVVDECTDEGITLLVGRGGLEPMPPID